VNVPGLRAKGDVSDWLDAGHPVAQLKALVDGAPLWRAGDTMPVLDWPELGEGDYHSMYKARLRRRSIYALLIPPPQKLLLIMLAEYEGPTQDDLVSDITSNATTDYRIKCHHVPYNLSVRSFSN
jgi:hypothetical protein